MNTTQRFVLPQIRRTPRVIRLPNMLRVSTASLDSLPKGVEFPEGLRERISFDPVERRLVFRGFMASAEYYLLSEMSDDPNYRSALEQIHHQSGFEIDHPEPLPVWLWLLVGSCLVGGAIIWWQLLIET
jgi:hypothetical protein